MTETTTATPATTDTAAETVTLPVLDDFGTMAVQKISGEITERNSLYKSLTAATGDRQGMLDELREQAEKGENAQPEVNALAAQISDLLSQVYDLETQRDNYLNSQIDALVEASGVDPKVVETQIASLESTIKSGTNYLIGIYGADVTGYLPALEGKRTRKSGTGVPGASGQRRIRGVEVYVDGVKATTPDANGVQRSTFSAAAKALSLDSVKPLQGAYTDLYGTDPDKFPADTEFDFQGHKVRVVKSA